MCGAYIGEWWRESRRGQKWRRPLCERKTFGKETVTLRCDEFITLQPTVFFCLSFSFLLWCERAWIWFFTSDTAPLALGYQNRSWPFPRELRVTFLCSTTPRKRQFSATHTALECIQRETRRCCQLNLYIDSGFGKRSHEVTTKYSAPRRMEHISWCELRLFIITENNYNYDIHVFY